MTLRAGYERLITRKTRDGTSVRIVRRGKVSIKGFAGRIAKVVGVKTQDDVCLFCTPRLCAWGLFVP